jgi:hypothetical protein
LPNPAAHTWPLSFCVHHCQFGSVCTAAFTFAVEGTPAGLEDWFEPELLEPLEVEPPLDVPPDEDPCEPEPGLAPPPCAGCNIGDCDCCCPGDTPPPQPASASKEALISAIHPDGNRTDSEQRSFAGVLTTIKSNSSMLRGSGDDVRRNYLRACINYSFRSRRPKLRKLDLCGESYPSTLEPQP